MPEVQCWAFDVVLAAGILAVWFLGVAFWAWVSWGEKWAWLVWEKDRLTRENARLKGELAAARAANEFLVGELAEAGREARELEED